MTTDEVLRTILIISVSFSLLIVAIQIARVLGAMRKMINDNNNSIKELVENSSEISSYLKEDYDTVRRFTGLVSLPTKSVKALFDFGIMGTVFNMVFKSRKSKKRDK